MNNESDFEDLRYRLSGFIKAILEKIAYCPDCRNDKESLEDIREQISRIRKPSGFKKVLKSLLQFFSKLGQCNFCEKFSEDFTVSYEKEIQRLLQPIERPPLYEEESLLISPEDLQRLIKTKYPFLISYAYKNLTRTQGYQRVDELINCFDITLRYVCYILLSDLKFRQRSETLAELKKLIRPDLGKKGIGEIIYKIHEYIQPDFQFISSLTNRFLSLSQEYNHLYQLRCNIKHEAHLSRSISDIQKIRLYEQHIETLNKFLNGLNVLKNYRLAIIREPISYIYTNHSMVYEISLCHGDDPDFSDPCKIKIHLDDLCENNWVILIKDLNHIHFEPEPNNILPLYPLIISHQDCQTGHSHLFLYKEFNSENESFVFFSSTFPNLSINKDSEIYSLLYRMIILGNLKE